MRREFTIAALLNQACEDCETVSTTPRLDAELLLSQALAKPRSYLYTWPERIPAVDQIESFRTLLRRRLAGEPIAYILGRREFWSLDLDVSPATLIPRPETELLVELALQHSPMTSPLRIADLGTGSGAIALAIASERPQAQIVASDISHAALAIARRNAARLGMTNIDFRQGDGDWYAALAGECFDIIVANPPYVAANSQYLSQGDLRFEPTAALVSGNDGLDAIRAIAAQAGKHLRAGWLLLEHGYDQGPAVMALLAAAGFDAISNHDDAAGLSRVSCGHFSSTNIV